MNWLKRHRFAIVATASVFAVLWLYLSSKSFQSCIDAQQNADAEKTFYEGISHFLIALGILRGCTGYFIGEAGNAITALATILIAIFTWTLWRTSAAQAQLTVVAIQDAKIASQRENRAYIEVLPKQIMYKDAATMFVFFWLKNTGQTPAFYLTCLIDIKVMEHPWKHPAKFTMAQEDEGKPIPISNIFPGGDQRIPKQFSWSEDDLKLLKAGRHAIYAFGRAEFVDAFKIKQWSEFCAFMD